MAKLVVQLGGPACISGATVSGFTYNGQPVCWQCTHNTTQRFRSTRLTFLALDFSTSAPFLLSHYHSECTSCYSTMNLQSILFCSTRQQHTARISASAQQLPPAQRLVDVVAHASRVDVRSRLLRGWRLDYPRGVENELDADLELGRD